jgi:tellurite resistance protein TerC
VRGEFGFPLETIVIFASVVSLSVWIDLRAHKRSHAITMRDAALWSVFWVALAVGFAVYLNFRFGSEAASLFFAGYVLEESLSIDNLMVFIAIFKNFGIRGAVQHRILYYGILGAVLFRLVFVAFGTGLFGLSNWVEFAFAAIVGWTGWKMLRAGGGEDEISDYSDHWAVGMTKRLVPIYPRLHADRFFVSSGFVQEARAADPSLAELPPAKLYGTPVLLCLVAVEISDVIFAFDSVPAVIAVTHEPLLVYAAVIFAILGLRSLYFILAAAQKSLVHLEKSVIALLFFISAKLALSASTKIFGWPTWHISPNLSLAIILGTLALGVLASFMFPPRHAE